MRLRPNNFVSLPSATRKPQLARRAFTLIEMLVVLVIIALLAALALPHIRGHSESVAINAACQQLVADLSYARQKAISQRSTVAVVFVSPEIFDQTLFPFRAPYNANEIAAIKRLQGGVYTYYALYQYRKVGDQPGIRDSYGYITEWKSLPEKTFLATNNFPGAFFGKPNSRFPFPFSTSPNTDVLPYIAFDWEGRCIEVDGTQTGTGTPVRDIDINVARGSILFTRETSGDVGSVLLANYDVQEIPPCNSTNNVIHIDQLTGRAKRVELELK